MDYPNLLKTSTDGFLKLLSTHPIPIVVWGNFPFNKPKPVTCLFIGKIGNISILAPKDNTAHLHYVTVVLKSWVLILASSHNHMLYLQDGNLSNFTLSQKRVT